MIENAHRTFWTYWLIGLGGLGLMTFLVVCWDGICDFFEGFFDLFFAEPLDEDQEEERRRRKQAVHRRRRRKWRIFLPFISRRRREWIMKFDKRHTERMCKDSMAECLATHENILDAMYDDSPSMGEIYRRVKERYRE